MEVWFSLVKYHLLFFSFFLSLRLEFSEAQMAPAMFVFGDSLVDVGNNNYIAVSLYKANFPHNGIDFPTKKPTGRFCNGKIAADLTAEKLGLPTSPPYLSLSKNKNVSYINGVSFASGGARIFHSSNKTLRRAISLSEQVEDYIAVHGILVEQLGSSATEKYFSKSIFAITIGSNDLFNYYGSSDLRKENSPQQFADLMAKSLKEQLKILYVFDARKFVLAGIGPMGCVPAIRAENKTHECNEERNFLSVTYNEALKAMLNGLKSELQGINYSYFDTYSFMQDVIQKPSAYGFNEAKAACCGLGDLKAKVPCLPIATYCPNRNDYVFWDPYHPTEAMNRVLVDTLFDGPSQYSVPMNLRQLVSV